jgi:hypothetical protein
MLFHILDTKLILRYVVPLGTFNSLENAFFLSSILNLVQDP